MGEIKVLVSVSSSALSFGKLFGWRGTDRENLFAESGKVVVQEFIYLISDNYYMWCR